MTKSETNKNPVTQVLLDLGARYPQLAKSMIYRAESRPPPLSQDPLNRLESEIDEQLLAFLGGSAEQTTEWLNEVECYAALTSIDSFVIKKHFLSLMPPPPSPISLQELQQQQ